MDIVPHKNIRIYSLLMKCFKTFLFLLFLLAAMLLSATDLHVLYTTDLHGHLEKIPAIAPALRQYGKDCIRIDAGDTLSGTFEADRLAGKTMIQLLNMLDYDIWVPGNHDFEMPLETFRKRAGEFKGTVLGAQWKWQSYTPEKWRMFQKKGYRIAVIGLTAPSMPHRILDPEQDGVFQQAYHTLKKLLPKIRKQRPDAIILVMHNGMYAKYFGASAAARAFPEINLILGGHSHQEEHYRKRFSNLQE